MSRRECRVAPQNGPKRRLGGTEINDIDILDCSEGLLNCSFRSKNAALASVAPAAPIGLEIACRCDGAHIMLSLTLGGKGMPGPAAARHPSNVGNCVLVVALVFGALGCLAARAQAPEWPTRPVRIIVPYGPGGIGDLLVRLTTERLAKTFGQTFVLENRPGGGGVLGVEYAARSPNDGYTLAQAGGAQFSVVPLMQKLNYDPLKDLTPVSIIAANGMALAVNVDLPVHSVGEFLEYAKNNPGKLNYGTGGVGTSSHLVPAAFAARAGLDMVAIPYQSTPASVLAVLNGTVQVFFGNIPDILETYRSGRVRLLALSNATRIPQFPDIPTIAETVPGFVMTGWNGYFAPAGTPEKIIRRLSQAVGEICRDPDVIKTMTGLGLEAVGNSPEDVAETIRRELPVYEAAVTVAGLRRK
jgi:tripartite-type tricarboxylate transporter receptor subunit TctC